MSSRLLSRMTLMRPHAVPRGLHGALSKSSGRQCWSSINKLPKSGSNSSNTSPIGVENEVEAGGKHANQTPQATKRIPNGTRSKSPVKYPTMEGLLPAVAMLNLKRSSAELTTLSKEMTSPFRHHHTLRSLVKGVYDPFPQGTATVNDHIGAVTVVDEVLKAGSMRVPNIWLRDNCQCATCVHTETKQRLLDTFKIPQDISIKSHEIQEDGINVGWSDGHNSKYTMGFLRHACTDFGMKNIVRRGLSKLEIWDSSIASDPPKVSYDWFSRGDFVKMILNRIRQYGFCYIDDVPFNEPEPTEKLLERISFIRPTHYGGFYDFTADLASADTAYTNIALEAHTDTTYFSDPAGLQAFHLLSHTEGEGGASLLVDGFKVAKDLYESDMEAYEVLSTVDVHCHASGNDGISIQPYKGFPVLQHDLTSGNLLQVRWNSSDRASVDLPMDRVDEWYNAARKWDALVKKKGNEYWEQLTPGRLLIFDNWRVMHGRSAFTGKRRICGAYINRDDWISKYKMLHHGREKVLSHLL